MSVVTGVELGSLIMVAGAFFMVGFAFWIRAREEARNKQRPQDGSPAPR